MKANPKEYQTSGPEEDEDIDIPETCEPREPDYIIQPCGKEPGQ